MPGKDPLKSWTINTALLQLITALLVGLVGWLNGPEISKLITDLVGPAGFSLLLAALATIKSLWDIYLRFRTSAPIRYHRER